jgi:tetratricopeptide (TPR) repeat protein
MRKIGPIALLWLAGWAVWPAVAIAAPPAGKGDEAARPKAEPGPDTPSFRDPQHAEPRKRPFHKAPGSSIPDDPAQRAKLLSDLYAHLATAEDEEAAQGVAAAIERVWMAAAGDTVGLLMERALSVYKQKQPQLALKLLDAVTELAPDFPEGWNRRAYVHYMESNTSSALGDLRRVLALDPSHFKALDGLGQILREIGQKRAALEVYRRLLAVHPFWSGAKAAVAELEREVKGQGI